MTPGIYNMTIYQGTTHHLVIAFKDSNRDVVDLTGCTARMQIRESFGTTIIKELTTENFKLVINALNSPDWNTTDETATNYIKPADISAGKKVLEMYLSDIETAALDFTAAKYDIEILAGGTVQRLLMGTVTLDQEVTV